MVPTCDLAALAAASGLPDAQVYVWQLPTGPRWECDDGRWIYPASTMKLPLAVAAGAAIAAGRLHWDTPVVVHSENETPNDADSPMAGGYATDVRELVTLMLQRSDNVATNELFDILDRERATADIHALGFPETFFRRKLSGADPLIDDPAATGRNSFPAREAAALLAALAAGTLPEAVTIREILATSAWDVKLSRGLSDGDRFAHKTGDTDTVSHDIGILQLRDGGSCAIVVYTEQPSTDALDRCFGAFMSALRPQLVDADLHAAHARAVLDSEGAPGADTKAARTFLTME